MAIGEINSDLEKEIDDIQAYIDFLWEQGRDKDVPVYQRIKDKLCKTIKGKEKK